jgi:conjugal transfer pilus assembly protein TraF
MLVRSAILSISLLLLGSIAAAQETIPVYEEDRMQASVPYYRDYKRGWYWYEKEKEQPKKDESKMEVGPKHRIPMLKDYAAETLWNMYPDDFQALLMDFQKKAVMSPTENNVAEYYYIQDIARRKSLAFANVTAAVMQKYPELSVAKDYPTATPGRSALTRLEGEEIEKKIAGSVPDYGLIYFYSPTCQYCMEQEKIVRYFEERYGWEIKRIDLTQNAGRAAMFNVTTVPAIILVYRRSQDPITVSAGVVSLEDMEERIYRGIRLLAGEISPEDYSLYDFQKGSTFDVQAPALRERKVQGGK